MAEKSTKKGQVHPTKERLQVLPFRSAAEEKEARRQIRLTQWRQVERARAMREYTRREEYAFLEDEFEGGLYYRLGKDKEVIVHAFRVRGDPENDEKPRVYVDINQTMMEARRPSEDPLPAYAKSAYEGLMNQCYRVLGYVPPEAPSAEDLVFELRQHFGAAS